MATWAEVGRELERRGNQQIDDVRREYMRAAEAISGRPLIVYATDFINPRKNQASGGETGIDNYDPDGFDEATQRISADAVDVLLQSPGGSPDSAESIVELLRSRFRDIRFIVPGMAKSAATMICCAGNEVWLDDRSELGPIDPQMVITRADGARVMAPAQFILKQFDLAKQTLAKNPGQMAAWMPLLQPLGPALLTQCEAANQLARELVETWLIKYMFAGSDDAGEKAKRLSDFLSNADDHLSHGRRVGFDELLAQGMNVKPMRSAPDFRAAIQKLYSAINWTFERSNAYKIIENSSGDAFIRNVIVREMIQLPIMAPPGIQPPAAVPSGAPGKRRRR